MQYSFYNGLRWLKRLVWIGFFINLIFVIPSLFFPRTLETWFEFGTTNTIHWLQNVGLLLLIVTLLYIPVTQDPFRYSFVTFLVIVGRFCAGLLFLFGVLHMNYPQGMWMLALTDLILSSLQAIAWFFALRDGDPKAGFQHGQTRTV